MMNALGAVIGLAAVTATLAIFHESRTGLLIGYAAVATVLLITTVITVVAVREPAYPTVRHDPLELDARLVGTGVAAPVAVAAWRTLPLVPLHRVMLPVALIAAAALPV